MNSFFIKDVLSKHGFDDVDAYDIQDIMEEFIENNTSEDINNGSLMIDFFDDILSVISSYYNTSELVDLTTLDEEKGISYDDGYQAGYDDAFWEISGNDEASYKKGYDDAKAESNS